MRIFPCSQRSLAYLYGSKSDCESEKGSLWSWFFVFYEETNSVFLVTAWHIVNERRVYLRLNEEVNEFSSMELTSPMLDWINDLAIYPIPNDDFVGCNHWAIFLDEMLNEDEYRVLDVGMWDQLTLLTRSLYNWDHSSIVWRFGEIAADGLHKINLKEPYGSQNVILCEYRSEWGYSGSPVFVDLKSVEARHCLCRTCSLRYKNLWLPKIKIAPFTKWFMWMNIWIESTKEDPNKLWSSFSLVLPSWKILERIKNIDEGAGK